MIYCACVYNTRIPIEETKKKKGEQRSLGTTWHGNYLCSWMAVSWRKTNPVVSYRQLIRHRRVELQHQGDRVPLMSVNHRPVNPASNTRATVDVWFNPPILHFTMKIKQENTDIQNYQGNEKKKKSYKNHMTKNYNLQKFSYFFFVFQIILKGNV